MMCWPRSAGLAACTPRRPCRGPQGTVARRACAGKPLSQPAAHPTATPASRGSARRGRGEAVREGGPALGAMADELWAIGSAATMGSRKGRTRAARDVQRPERAPIIRDRLLALRIPGILLVPRPDLGTRRLSLLGPAAAAQPARQCVRPAKEWTGRGQSARTPHCCWTRVLNSARVFVSSHSTRDCPSTVCTRMICGNSSSSRPVRSAIARNALTHAL